MASSDVESIFSSTPIELIFQSIKKRWEDMKQHTKLPLNEFLNGLEIFMDSLYFKFDDALGQFFYILNV